MNSKNTALIVIDIQKDFCTKGSAYNKLGYPIEHNFALAKKINKAIKQFRDKNIPIYFILSNYDDFVIKGDKCVFCLSGSKGTEPCLPEEKADRIIIKKTHDGFYNTKLDFFLKKDKVKNILIAGISTSVCVDSTARSGVARGYNVVVLSNLVASRNKDFHKFALDNFKNNFGEVDNSKNLLKKIK
ncbi:MAG TPA: cysteine hydrolase [Patescibacteria group bacterium]|nr:cysteine hydrolase [Patescibacteria group bacterium]